MGVVNELIQRGHYVDVLEPQLTITGVSELVAGKGVDAVVLRTVSGGPGLSLLDAASAAGMLTINDAQSVHRVRDKVVAASIAHAGGLPFPDTYFATKISLLEQLSESAFPLVVKPNLGGFGQQVRLLRTRSDLEALDDGAYDGGNLVAQPWVSNPGYDLKLYNTGQGLFAVRYQSPLLGGAESPRELVALTPTLRRLAERVGWAYQLQFYGADVVRSPRGWVVVDVNDFPSFGMVPDAAAMVASTVLEITCRKQRA
jgi:ribosomal protein S6--L-glutamate ligase